MSGYLDTTTSKISQEPISSWEQASPHIRPKLRITPPTQSWPRVINLKQMIHTQAVRHPFHNTPAWHADPATMRTKKDEHVQKMNPILPTVHLLIRVKAETRCSAPPKSARGMLSTLMNPKDERDPEETRKRSMPIGHAGNGQRDVA